MRTTAIQWTHSTINPTSGCDGCELYHRPPPTLKTPEELRAWLLQQPCYASQVHELRWAGSLAVTHPQRYAKHFYEVRTIAGRMAQAASWGPVSEKEAAAKPWFSGRRRHIFISDMSDALSRDVPFEFLKSEIIESVASERGRRHVFQWLTKRPDRMAEFDRWLADRGIAWPENLWAGTSVTSQRTAAVRIPAIRRVRATVRFLSCEPLFEAVTIQSLADLANGGIRWVIVGGASGEHAAAFDPHWARMLITECRDAGIACFVKQLGANPKGLKLEDSHGGDWNEWPVDLRVRQVPQEQLQSAA